MFGVKTKWQRQESQKENGQRKEKEPSLVPGERNALMQVKKEKSDNFFFPKSNFF